MKISRPACGTTRRWACGTPRGKKNQVARASPELLIAALVDVLPLDDVVHLVLAGMHVPRGIQQRSRLFEHGKGAARHRRRRTDDDRRPTEDQLLALARPPGNARGCPITAPTVRIMLAAGKLPRLEQARVPPVRRPRHLPGALGGPSACMPTAGQPRSHRFEPLPGGTSSTGTHGPAATRRAHDGSTSAPDSTANTDCPGQLATAAALLDSTCGYLASRPANRLESSPGEGIPWISGYRM